MSEKPFAYGLIEGFYGKPWRWEDRSACVSFLKAHQYGFYIYAPKTDGYLREKWAEDWPCDAMDHIARFSEDVKRRGLRIGIGLSPFEIRRGFNRETKALLHRKLRLINDLKPDILCILFDDMKGNQADLARMQAAIIEHCIGISTAESFIVCPTYYSLDASLERIFGKMPEGYHEDLGKMLDPAVDIFWTGDRVCSSGYTQSHLDDVSERLKRKPFIWDNYPVNDSPQMASYLHLRAFKDRPYQMAGWTSGHAVNPMNQAYLSQIPLKTLAMNYEAKSRYSPEKAFIDAARSLCGPDLGGCIIQNVSLFQDRGLKRLEQVEKDALIDNYQCFASPYAAEIVAWLRGEYTGQVKLI